MSAATFLAPFGDLTPEQRRVVTADMNGHRVIFGPPGSGKTLVLIHRAAHLAARHRVDPADYRVVVFTNVLKDYIRAGLDFLGIPIETVTTFDSLCQGLYTDHIGRRVPRDEENHRPDFDAIRRAVFRMLKQTPAVQGSLAFVVVDEGQDLTREAYAILGLVAKHVTVFADPKQRIFSGGASEAQMLAGLGLQRRSGAMLAAFRNSPDVGRLAAWFIADKGDRVEYLAQIRNISVPRERPLLYLAASMEDEAERLAAAIRQRQSLNQRVGIIVPRSNAVYGLSNALAARGVAVERAVPPSRRGDSTWTGVRFDTAAPKIATYHSAKGLTFDAVLLPRLTRGAFRHGEGKDDVVRLLFVGISRATQWVYLSTEEGNELSELDLLHKAAGEGQLVLQRHSDKGSTRTGPAPSGDDDEDDEEEISLF
ncbi:MAG: AAA family ATPase [Armatimonadetes bacterium]|nr:AAA family ATPase [Armatimonadota bacterium]